MRLGRPIWGKFPDFHEGDVEEAATVLFRYRIRPMDLLRRTDRGSRTFLVHDLRDSERLSFPEIRFISHLFAHIPRPSSIGEGQGCPKSKKLSPPKSSVSCASTLAPSGWTLPHRKLWPTRSRPILPRGETRYPYILLLLSPISIRNRGATPSRIINHLLPAGRRMPATRTARRTPAYPISSLDVIPLSSLDVIQYSLSDHRGVLR